MVAVYTVYGETGKVSQKALSQNLGQGKQNSYISFKPTIPEASDLYASFYVCMHDYANFIYSATASSVPTHCQSPWLHHRAVEWNKTELVIFRICLVLHRKNVLVVSKGHPNNIQKYSVMETNWTRTCCRLCTTICRLTNGRHGVCYCRLAT